MVLKWTSELKHNVYLHSTESIKSVHYCIVSNQHRGPLLLCLIRLEVVTRKLNILQFDNQQSEVGTMCQWTDVEMSDLIIQTMSSITCLLSDWTKTRQDRNWTGKRQIKWQQSNSVPVSLATTSHSIGSVLKHTYMYTTPSFPTFHLILFWFHPFGHVFQLRRSLKEPKMLRIPQSCLF